MNIYGLEKCGEQTKKVIAVTRKSLKQEERGDYRLIGSTIKVHANIYSELPKDCTRVTPGCFEELAVLQCDNIYHSDSDLHYICFIASFANMHKISKPRKNQKKTPHSLPSGGVPT